MGASRSGFRYCGLPGGRHSGMSLPPWWILNGVTPGGPDKDMGTWTAISFSPEQQQQFGINDSGEVLDQGRFDAAIQALKATSETAPETAPVAPVPLPKLDVADGEMLKSLIDPLIIDARDQNEIDANKGGIVIEGSKNVPVNMDGVNQSVHPTTT